MATSVKWPISLAEGWGLLNAASQKNTVVGIRKFFTSSLRLIIFRHFSATYDFVAEKKRLVVFLTASGELLGSPSVSKPLEKSWTYLYVAGKHIISLSHSRRRRKEKISLYCMQASDAIGLYPHTSPINWGSTLSCIWCNACTEIDISQVSEWHCRYSAT